MKLAEFAKRMNTSKSTIYRRISAAGIDMKAIRDEEGNITDEGLSVLSDIVAGVSHVETVERLTAYHFPTGETPSTSHFPTGETPFDTPERAEKAAERTEAAELERQIEKLRGELEEARGQIAELQRQAAERERENAEAWRQFSERQQQIEAQRLLIAGEGRGKGLLQRMREKWRKGSV